MTTFPSPLLPIHFVRLYLSIQFVLSHLAYISFHFYSSSSLNPSLYNFRQLNRSLFYFFVSFKTLQLSLSLSLARSLGVLVDLVFQLEKFDLAHCFYFYWKFDSFLFLTLVVLISSCSVCLYSSSSSSSSPQSLS